jgi:acyl carrier protein
MTGALLDAPESTLEADFAQLLTGVLRVDEVPPEDHFFDDLGADSLLMAQFCARVRKREGMPSVSMKEVYAHPTLRDLASSFDDDLHAVVVFVEIALGRWKPRYAVQRPQLR